MPNFKENMKATILILLIVLLLIGSDLTYGCDCDSQGEFLIVALKTELVALVKVKEYLSFKSIYGEETPISMKVEINIVFKGQENRKLITVWGDNGVLCRPYLSQFKVDKYYVIAFNKGEDGAIGNVHSNEKPTDYAISICGDYWLKADIEKELATGSVTKNQNNISFESLLEYFNGNK